MRESLYCITDKVITGWTKANNRVPDVIRITTTNNKTKYSTKSRLQFVILGFLVATNMSLLPLLLELQQRPRRLNDQQFALAITPEDLLSMISPPREYYRPWTQLANSLRDVGSTIKTDRKKFQINLDVQHFAPEEISVKTADGYLIIEAHHEEKKDQHGWVARQFTRRYALPEGCNLDGVESKLSSDGVLTVTAPLEASASNERIVPIMQTGPVKTQPDKPEIGNGEPPKSVPVTNGQ